MTSTGLPSDARENDQQDVGRVPQERQHQNDEHDNARGQKHTRGEIGERAE